MGSKTVSKAFSDRLRRICDTHDREDLRSYGRQAVIARAMDVSEETVRKWFSGAMAPRPDKAKKLAKFLGVDEVWLVLGRDPDVGAKEQKVLARNASGAVLYVRGLLQLAGGITADVGTRESRKFVDFYLTVDGQQTPVHVAFGRETEDGFVIPIPAEHDETLVLAVLPYRSGYLVLEMPDEMIDRLAFRKAGERAVVAERAEGGGFVTDGEEWPRLRPGALPRI